MQKDRWNPEQYNKFRQERMAPFFDLVSFIKLYPNMRIIDLGCGTGELTEMISQRLPDASIEGIDSSESMIEQANPRSTDRLTFRLQDIMNIEDYTGYDLIFSNATLHWIEDNEKFLSNILSQMKPGAQIAVQVPKNELHPSHSLAAVVAQQSPFREMLDNFVSRSGTLSLDRYATLLYEHGVSEQVCIEKIYGHLLAHTSDVVEWVKGTTLTPYLSRLDEEGKRAFLDAYRERLLSAIGDRSPYFYSFRRLLFWGKREK
jgi:trans-aconitate 2-methyltransferase